MTISQQNNSLSAAAQMIRLLADEARKDLGTKSPTEMQLAHARSRLDGIVKLMDEVVLPQVVLPPIPNASDVEKKIVGKLVRDLLAAGYCLTIWNGGDEAELKRSTDEAAIFAALAASDQDEIEAHHPSSKHRAGWVRLVWGNDASVISDYTTNFESVMAGANALADELEG